MMMTVDEKLHAYAKNQKDRNIDEKKLQQTIIKSKEAYWDGEIERNMSWLEFLYQQASYIQKHWWFAQGAVLLILWMTMFLSDSSIYTRRCMGILAPSFVILILPELWKNRSNGKISHSGTQEEIIQSVPVKVWSCVVANNEVEMWQKQFKVSNMKTLSDGIELRILSEKSPHYNAKEETMTLEDIFLYYFGEKTGDDYDVL